MLAALSWHVTLGFGGRFRYVIM